MKRTGSKGLMAFWADIAPDYVTSFREWHNCEHVTERVSIPGFHAGRRYVGIDGAPLFLMYYETESAAVLAGPDYHARLNAPTPWTKASLPHFRNPDRNVFSLLAECGAPAPTEAPYTVALRFNLPADREAALRKALVEDWAPKVAALDGVFRARVYEIDREVSGIKTEEAKLHGAEAGTQFYLVMIDAASGDLARSDAFKAVDAALARERVQETIGAYWLDLALYAPSRYLD
jgi:hypothetical protein